MGKPLFSLRKRKHSFYFVLLQRTTPIRGQVWMHQKELPRLMRGKNLGHLSSYLKGRSLEEFYPLMFRLRVVLDSFSNDEYYLDL